MKRVEIQNFSLIVENLEAGQQFLVKLSELCDQYGDANFSGIVTEKQENPAA